MLQASSQRTKANFHLNLQDSLSLPKPNGKRLKPSSAPGSQKNSPAKGGERKDGAATAAGERRDGTAPLASAPVSPSPQSTAAPAAGGLANKASSTTVLSPKSCRRILGGGRAFKQRVNGGRTREKEEKVNTQYHMNFLVI